MRRQDQRRDTITWHDVARDCVAKDSLSTITSEKSEKFAWDESRKTWLALEKWSRVCFFRCSPIRPVEN